MERAQQIQNMLELRNASQFPRMYYARHMEPGVCRYDAQGQMDAETVFLNTETLQRMAPTFVGMPVYVYHRNVDVKNIKADASGYVTESFYNELDGWFWVKFIMIDDDGHDSIGAGFAVSNAYIPRESDNGGSWHNVPYDRQITDAVYTHLALVPDPRYEDACILTPEEYRIYQDERRVRLNEMRNSKEAEDQKSNEGNKFMKFFKNTQEEVSADKVDGDTLVELQNGKTAKLSDMVAALEAEEKSNSLKNAKIKVGKTEMTVAELEEKYNAMLAEKANADDDKEAKENEADEDDKAKENADDDKEDDDGVDTKTNEADSDKGDDGESDDATGDKGGKEKSNSKGKKDDKDKKHFAELKNAHNKQNVGRQIFTAEDRVKRGQALYGSGTQH